LIEYLLKPMDEHTEEAKEAEERTALKVPTRSLINNTHAHIV
jgi:hypothetical protein